MMKEGIPVSIVLPTYNRAGKIGNAIESVLRSTYPHFELLIIDDGSVDETETVVSSYQDKRIKYYKMSQNGGQSKARNYGMQISQYDYIAFEDSDDLWRPEKLELQMQAILSADADVGFAYHKLRYDLGGGRSFILPDEKVATEKKNGGIYAQLLWDNLVGMPTLLVKKECIKAVGYLDESLQSLEDYDFALRLAQRYKAIFLDEILLDAEFSDEGVSGNSYQYILASCMILQKYINDYKATNTLSHRLEIILRDSERLGIIEKIEPLLQKIVQLK